MLTHTQYPPAESIDDPVEWIYHMDPCWDIERIKRERDRLRDAAARDPGPLREDASDSDRAAHAKAIEARARAADSHPVTRWRGGETGYSLAAKLTMPESLRSIVAGDLSPASTVAISEYWTTAPTRFVRRPFSALAWRRAADLLRDPHAWVIETCRHVIDHVLVPVDGDTKRLDPPRDADGRIAIAWIDWLDRQPRCASLLDHLATEASSLRLREDARGKL